MNKEEFTIALQELNIFLTEEQLQQLSRFYHLLMEWNKVINLTRIVEEDEVYLKHFYDSLTLKKAIDLEKVETLCDVGSGAGFPGIVLKIVFPHLKITLIDSLNKRVNYLKEVISSLGLNDIDVIHIRAEDFVPKEKFDLVTCRAVAKLPKLFEFCHHLVKKNGYFIPMKATVEEELEEAIKIQKKYRFSFLKKEEFYLPIEKSIRTLVVFRKD